MTEQSTVRTTATMKGTVSAVKIHGPNSPTPGRIEDLGVIASTEAGTLTVSEKIVGKLEEIQRWAERKIDATTKEQP